MNIRAVSVYGLKAHVVDARRLKSVHGIFLGREFAVAEIPEVFGRTSRSRARKLHNRTLCRAVRGIAVYERGFGLAADLNEIPAIIRDIAVFA